MTSIARILAAALALAVAPLAAHAGPRVFSLDQCADQYVLALAPRAEIVGLSPRVLAADSYMRAAAVGLPRRRATSEAVLGARASVVVRSWGGDARLQAMLVRRGLTVVAIDDSTDFAGVRANVRKVAAALDTRSAGEALIARMDAQLAAAHGAWGGRGAVYLTPAGYTAGPGTLIDAVLTSAGLTNLSRAPYFSEIPLERMVMNPPPALVLGFYDAYGVAAQQWGPGRNAAMQRIARQRAIATLPASLIGCPGWFAADAVTILAKARGGPR
jgi:iron complex transport system substrate-binding protein